MASITYNLFCFLANIDFARNFVKYISSKDFSRLIFVHKEFTPKYIMRLIKQDYKSLYYNFISQREKYYPLIFNFHFKYHNVDTLSEYLAQETINNLKSNQPMIYIPDQRRNFNPHDKKIREILYQCFSLYLSKPIQIVGEDGTISFDEVGSVAYSNLVINKDGKWVCNFKDGIYYNPEESRYNENEELDPLGFYDDSLGYLETCRIYEICINPLFVLLHKFDIKLKHKLIVDRIVISPFEQQIDAMDLHEKICKKFLFPHHMNCLYGNIEDNLELITRLDMNRFYSLISAISTGILPDVNKYKDEYNCVNTYLLGDDINIYRGMFSIDSWANDFPYVNSLVEHFTYNYNQQDLQPHLKTKKYDTARLLDYIDWPSLI
jgi:hypothetical protein